MTNKEKVSNIGSLKRNKNKSTARYHLLMVRMAVTVVGAASQKVKPSSDPAPCLCARETEENGPSIRVPATCMGNPDELLGSWLWPGLVSAVANIWV